MIKNEIFQSNVKFILIRGEGMKLLEFEMSIQLLDGFLLLYCYFFSLPRFLKIFYMITLM